ncbi:MAG: DegT/DnrJ/EryC1/StrS family aminotransferase [Chitinophagaceae bacterium]|nr:DegT/DnrJ/EryC1/StrS family aminotransferase [Chitinophagaceae bacterium]
MKHLQMVDLKSQYEKIKDDVQSAMQEVIETTAFINGPQVSAFAHELQEYLHAPHVIPCANGTDALQIAMMALGLQPGDEVITPSFTYIATVEVVGLLHLKPVFCEVDARTFTMDVTQIEKLITPKTRAIVPVHLYGQSADMESIMAIAEKHHLYVIEDNAQAIGGTYTFKDGTKKANGTMGHIGTTSFFPSKNLGCYGDGGALYTNDDALAEKIKMIANHGQKVKYIHEIVGCNSRLDTLQAAVLRVKLKHLDEYCDARRSVADRYDQAFANHPEIQTPYRAPYSHHVYHQYTLILNHANRDAVQEQLKEKGIPSMIYYPIPAHKQKMFASFGLGDLQLPVTDELTSKVISLPIHTEMSQEDQEYIIHHFLEIVKGLS